MPYRKNQFNSGDIYHTILRGIDDNLIFKDVSDYYRGIFSIYEFNTTFSITIQEQRRARAVLKNRICGGRAPTDSAADKRDKLVDLLAFCFMPNHIHLLLKQVKDDGITKFMKKVGTGYAGYFNRKYKRKGYVFQNRFRDVRIESDGQLMVVLNYIHANPVSLVEPGWKENGIGKVNEAIEFIENYKWSSYQDYLGKKNFPSVTERNFMLETMGGPDGCKNFSDDWVKYKAKIANHQEILLD